MNKNNNARSSFYRWQAQEKQISNFPVHLYSSNAHSPRNFHKSPTNFKSERDIDIEVDHRSKPFEKMNGLFSQNQTRKRETKLEEARSIIDRCRSAENIKQIANANAKTTKIETDIQNTKTKPVLKGYKHIIEEMQQQSESAAYDVSDSRDQILDASHLIQRIRLVSKDQQHQPKLQNDDFIEEVIKQNENLILTNEKLQQQNQESARKVKALANQIQYYQFVLQNKPKDHVELVHLEKPSIDQKKKLFESKCVSQVDQLQIEVEKYKYLLEGAERKEFRLNQEIRTQQQHFKILEQERNKMIFESEELLKKQLTKKDKFYSNLLGEVENKYIKRNLAWQENKSESNEQNEQKMKEQYLRQRESLKREIESLRKELACSEKSSTERWNQSLKDQQQMEEFQHQIQSLAFAYSQKNQSFEEKQFEIYHLQHQTQAHLSTITQLQSQLQTHQLTITSFQRQIHQLNQEKHWISCELENTHRDTDLDHFNLEERTTVFQNEIAKLKKTIFQLQESIQNLTQNLMQIQQAKEQGQIKIKTQNDQNITLKKTIISLECFKEKLLYELGEVKAQKQSFADSNNFYQTASSKKLSSPRHSELENKKISEFECSIRNVQSNSKQEIIELKLKLKKQQLRSEEMKEKKEIERQKLNRENQEMKAIMKMLQKKYIEKEIKWGEENQNKQSIIHQLNQHKAQGMSEMQKLEEIHNALKLQTQSLNKQLTIATQLLEKEKIFRSQQEEKIKTQNNNKLIHVVQTFRRVANESIFPFSSEQAVSAHLPFLDLKYFNEIGEIEKIAEINFLLEKSHKLRLARKEEKLWKKEKEGEKEVQSEEKMKNCLDAFKEKIQENIIRKLDAVNELERIKQDLHQARENESLLKLENLNLSKLYKALVKDHQQINMKLVDAEVEISSAKQANIVLLEQIEQEKERIEQKQMQKSLHSKRQQVFFEKESPWHIFDHQQEEQLIPKHSTKLRSARSCHKLPSLPIENKIKNNIEEQLLQYQIKNQKLTLEATQLKSQIEQLQQERREMSRKCKNNEEKCRQLSKHIDRLNCMHQESLKLVISHRGEISELQAKQHLSKLQFDQMLSAKDQTILQLQASLKNLNQHRLLKNSTFSPQTAEIHRLLSEKSILISALQFQCSNLKDSLNNSESACRIYQEKLKKLQSNINELNCQKSIFEETLSKIKFENEEASEEKCRLIEVLERKTIELLSKLEEREMEMEYIKFAKESSELNKSMAEKSSPNESNYSFSEFH